MNSYLAIYTAATARPPSFDPPPKKCPKGYAHQSDDEWCSPCPQGTYWKCGACVLCQPGTHSSVEASLKCLRCTGGTAALYSGETHCSTCSEGCTSYDGIVCACPDVPAATSPPKCAVGYIPDGAGSCKACPPGTYWGEGVCAECKPGTYSSAEASLKCLPCTGGLRAFYSGQTHCEACQEYCTSYEGIYCRCGPHPTDPPCPRGYVRDWKYHSGSCEACPPGTKWGEGGCRKCKPGTYSSAEASYTCLPCTGGMRAPGEGNTHCYPCDHGTSYDGITCYLGPVPAPTRAPTRAPIIRPPTIVAPMLYSD
jgi:hypothetical protein